jgi:hypothetical protein
VRSISEGAAPERNLEIAARASEACAERLPLSCSRAAGIRGHHPCGTIALADSVSPRPPDFDDWANRIHASLDLAVRIVGSPSTRHLIHIRRY